MHEKVRHTRNKAVVLENVLIMAAVVVCIVVAAVMDNAGMPQKWHAAVVGTGLSFLGVAVVYKRNWRLTSFWIAFCLWFAVHLAVITWVFAVVFASVQTIGILIWSPVAFGEGLFLLKVVGMTERHLRSAMHSDPHRHEK
jgi:hypothetical protein